MKSVTVNISE